jgi:hypothetical protein
MIGYLKWVLSNPLTWVIMGFVIYGWYSTKDGVKVK